MSGIPTEPAMTPQKQTCLHLCGKDITADRSPTPQYTIVSYLPVTTNEVQFITNISRIGLELRNGLPSSGASNFVQVNTNNKFSLSTYVTKFPTPTTPQNALSHILTVAKSQA